jgi:hypothetical protein
MVGGGWWWGMVARMSIGIGIGTAAFRQIASPIVSDFGSFRIFWREKRYRVGGQTLRRNR